MNQDVSKRALLPEVRHAFKATLPVLTGYVVLGIGFGILLGAAGGDLFASLAMSVFIYAGSMQYLAIDLLSAGASLITVALTTLMVNARHLFYGISMVEKYRGMGKIRPYLIFALTDETYSLVCSSADGLPQPQRRRYFLMVSLFDHLYWITGCVLGSLLGAFLPFSTEGIDFALTALFITVFTDQWLSSRQHMPALTGVAASVLCLLIFGADNFLIPTMVLITCVLTLLRKPLEGKEAAHE